MSGYIIQKEDWKGEVIESSDPVPVEELKQTYEEWEATTEGLEKVRIVEVEEQTSSED